MTHLLIIGAGEAGRMLVGELRRSRQLSERYRVEGFIDDDAGKRSIDAIPVLGTVNDVEEIHRSLGERGIRISEIIIAIPSAKKEEIDRIVARISYLPARIRIVPGLFEIVQGSFSFQQVRRFEPTDLLGREEVGLDLDRIGPYYEGKTIFVTGAGGSIGSEVFVQLLSLPVKEVVALGHGENSIHLLIGRVGTDPRFRYVIGDVRDPAKLAYEMQRFQPDIVFHAAAHKHVPLMEDYPDEALKNNVIGTYNCARAAIDAGVSDFLLVSTDKAVNPTSVMGKTKRIAERIVLSLNALQTVTQFRLTRFGNVLGSRGSVIPIFREQIERGGPVTVTHPEMTRYFMSIREAARLVIKSVTIPAGRIFVLDMGKPVSILELAKNMIRLSGHSEQEIPIVFTGLRPGEKMYEEILTASESVTKTEFEKLFVSQEGGSAMTAAELQRTIDKVIELSKCFDRERILGEIDGIAL